MMKRLLPAAAMMLGLALPASATPPPEMPKASERELYCITNGLETANTLGDVGAALRGSGDKDKGQAALDSATNACRAQFGWTEARAGLAQLMATYVAMKSEAAADIYTIYETDDNDPIEMAMHSWQPVADEMPGATEDLLLEGGQLHPDVISRLRDTFNDAGLPGSDDYYFSTAMSWMQANAAENAVRKRWIAGAN